MNVSNLFDQFMDNRKFHGSKTVEYPELCAVDYADLGKLRQEVRRKGCLVNVFIVSNDMNGSKQKIDITKHCLFDYPSENGPNANVKIDLQFILDVNCNKFHRNAVYGVFDSVLLKFGIGLYSIDPMLPSNKFGTSSLWIFGIRVHRNIKGVNLAVITCNRSPWQGALKFITSRCFPIPKRTDVIPQYLMRQMMKEILVENMNIIQRSHGREKSPQNMIFLRNGLADSLFIQCISKEVAGIKQELNAFIDEEKNDIDPPGVIYTVIQEHVNDVFGVNNNGKYEMIRAPILINEGITSGQWLAVYMADVYKQECEYLRVLRWITLWDEYHENCEDDGLRKVSLCDDANLLSDYYQIIFAQFYGYAPGIPFAKKPKLPGPLLYADHAGDWQYELMTESETDLNRMNIDVINSKPKICAIDTDIPM